MKQIKFNLNMDDEFNEISMIKDSTNVETNNMDEGSFSLDLLKNMIGGSSNFAMNINHGNIKRPLFSKYILRYHQNIVDAFDNDEEGDTYQNFIDNDMENEEDDKKKCEEQIKEIWDNCENDMEEL